VNRRQAQLPPNYTRNRAGFRASVKHVVNEIDQIGNVHWRNTAVVHIAADGAATLTQLSQKSIMVELKVKGLICILGR